MRLAEKGELSLLEEIRARFKEQPATVLAGIGDDAAILSVGGRKLLATTDMMLEDVHFDLRLITPYQLGFKLVSVNVSDIYAMGGRPSFALIGIAAPRETETAFLDGLMEGVAAALRLYGASLVGGDLSASTGKVSLSATLLGYARRPVRRAGARTGEGIYVTGNLGESACGLRLLRVIKRPVDLEAGVEGPLEWEVMRPLLKRHLMPEARRPDAFVKHASAMIDLSDGLFMDLTRLCAESGIGARLYEGRIPVSGNARAAAAFLGLDPMGLATGGGEDYELLFTASLERKLPAIRIGEVTDSKGISLLREDGAEVAPGPEGYQHFSPDIA